MTLVALALLATVSAGGVTNAPPTPADAAYESRLRSSMASAQAFQGPLDGGWMLQAAGRDLFALQLVDRAGRVEGAWRDLRRADALDAWGFIDLVERGDGDLRFRLGDRAVTLRSGVEGRWSGELIESGVKLPVTLRRRGP